MVLRLPRGLEAGEDLPYPIINHFDHAVGGCEGLRQQSVIAVAAGRDPGALILWMNTGQVTQVRRRLRQIIKARGRKGHVLGAMAKEPIPRGRQGMVRIGKGAKG